MQSVQISAQCVSVHVPHSGMCDERATQLCAVAARQLKAVTKFAFDEKFYLMLVRGSMQLRQLLTAVDVVRATFTEPRILEELARELRISGQEVQSALSHLATDRADKLSRGGNAPLLVVSVRCSSLGLYALWCYSSPTPRLKGLPLTTTCVRGKCHPSALLWWLPRRCQVGGVGICRLWPRIVSEAGTALALVPRVLRCFDK